MSRSFGFIFTILAVMYFSSSSQFSTAQTPESMGERKGLSFSSPHTQESETSGVFLAVCGGTDDQPECNPYTGDMLCNIKQPVLCFLDIDAPVPATLSRAQNWTSGVLALSSPIPGNRFARLSDANAYCAATFGAGWRVASFHDGGGWTLKGYGLAPSDKTRFWVDIKDQPQGTCWSR